MSTMPWVKGVSFHAQTKTLCRGLPPIRPKMIERVIKNGQAKVEPAHKGRAKIWFKKDEMAIEAIVIMEGKKKVKNIISAWGIIGAGDEKRINLLI